MKSAFLLLIAAAVPAFGQYNALVSDPLTGSLGTYWVENGSFSGGGSSGNASLIYNNSVPIGSQEYEVRGTFNIPLSLTGSPTYVLYSQASSNALYSTVSGQSTGTFYALVLNNFQWTAVGGQQVCTADMALYKNDAGSGTPAALDSPISFTCGQTTVVRFIYGALHQMVVYVGLPGPNGNTYNMYGLDSDLTGSPGVGAMDTAGTGSSVTEAQIYQPDLNPPNAVDATTIGTSVFYNEADFQWQGVSDDTSGGGQISGVAMYLVHRSDFPATYWDSMPAGFADTTVQPQMGYSYTIIAADYYLNESRTNVTVVTPPANYIPPREVGVRRLGTYWGGEGERIDMRSGNLNYTLPLFSAMGRNGRGVPFSLSYNSQMWRLEYAAGQWQLVWQVGRDLGYGYGWNLQAGSLTPVWGSDFAVHHYLYRDSTGAEYRLDQKTSQGSGYYLWTSKEGIYVTYNDLTNRLTFPDGSFWTFGCTSAGTEADAGTMYPTVIEDANGNQVTVSYNAGIGVTWANSSGRINQIFDSRGPGGFTFSYSGEALPHLLGISDSYSGAGNYAFQYDNNSQGPEPYTITSPFPNPPLSSYGTADILTSAIQQASARAYGFSYVAGSHGANSTTGEMATMTTPDLGALGWAYSEVQYYGNRVQDEVTTRRLTMSQGASPYTYNIVHTDAQQTDVIHQAMTVYDPGTTGISGASEKDWVFQIDPAQPYLGLAEELVWRVTPSTITGARVEAYAYSNDANGNPYVSTDAVTLDYQNTPGQTTMATTQTLDIYGNVLGKQIYNYGYTGSGSSPIRTYTNTYMTTSNDLNAGLDNLLAASTVQDGNGNSAALVQNTFDNYAAGGLTAAPSVPNHDSNYGTNVTLRGLVTTQVTPANTVTAKYDTTGMARSSSDGTTQVQITPDPSTNTVPTAITPNGSTALQTSIGYNGWLGPTSVTGPNNSTDSAIYDPIGRVSSTTSIYGAATVYTYTAATSSTPSTVEADVEDNGYTKVRYTLTTLDGFGRPARVERGSFSGATKSPVSWTDTQYVACGCSPLGKMGAVSEPYTPKGALVWAHRYQYDGLGRTTQDTLGTGGVTAYAYSGNTTTVTPPIQNDINAWKTNTTDALGNLTQVAEPDPTLGTVTTGYQYDVLGHLTSVTMPRGGTTQTRTFNYNTGSTVGAYLLSATNPESGTARYAYNADGTLQKKRDAKSQEVRYSYDSYKRATKIQRGTFTGTWPSETFTPVAAQETDFTYDTGTSCANGAGRLCTVTYTGTNAGETTNQLADAYTESYAYSVAGEVIAKQFGMTRTWQISQQAQSSASLGFTANYNYDSEGRVTSVNYPLVNNCSDTQNCTNVAGPAYSNSFDAMGRLSGTSRTDYAQTIASGAAYNVANELTYLGLGASNGYESRGYDAQMPELLTGITYAPNGNPQAYTIGYNYQSNLLLAQQVYQSYQPAFSQVISHFYDSLNRLSEANTNSGDTLVWAHTYSHDGFGNLTATDTSTSQGVNPANNQLTGLCLPNQGACYDANGNQLYMPYGAPPENIQLVYDIENRLVQVGGPGGNGMSGVIGKYAYNHLNQRVWRLGTEGSTTTEEIYFYGVDGQRLASYTLAVGVPNQGDGNIATLTATASDVQIYFGHKLVQGGAYSATAQGHLPAGFIGQDMVGSVRADGKSSAASNFYPWGVEQGTVTANDRVKFGTYLRDGESGIDYAMNRYYNSLTGRFLTPDPEYGGELANPISMNLYNYTLGDPVNSNDATGLAPTTCGSAGFSFNGVYQGTISSILSSGSNQAIIAQTAYTESGHGANVDVTDEEYAIAGVLMNRWEFANKNWYLFAGPVGPGSQPIPVGSYGAGGSNINSIAENPGQFAVYQKNQDGSISLTPSAQKNLNGAINSDASSSLCNDLAWALTEGYSMWGERNDGDPLYLYGGLILTGFNSFGHSSTAYEQRVGSFGDANTFYGVPESYVDDKIPPRKPRPIRPPRPPRRPR